MSEPRLFTLKIQGYDIANLITGSGLGLLRGSLQLSHMLTYRTTGRFQLATQTVIFVPRFGNRVEIYDREDPSRLVFGGTIDEVRPRMRVNDENLIVDVTLNDWHQVLDSLLVTGVWRNQTAGEIVRLLFEAELGTYPPCSKLTGDGSEGFTLERVDDGPAVPLFVADYISVAELLERLAKLSFDDNGNQYAWWVTPAQGVHFHVPEPDFAPFAIQDDNGSFLMASLELTSTRKDYATEAFLRFAPSAAEQEVTFSGDNFAKEFPRPEIDPPDPQIRPMAEEPQVTLNTIPQQVGELPEDVNPGFDWYWDGVGGTRIVQAAEAPPIGLFDVLTVRYRPLFADVIGAVNDAEVADYANASGLQGKIQIIQEQTDLTDAGTIQLTVERIRDRVSKKGLQITFDTDLWGLMPGQVIYVTLNSHNLGNVPFVVDQVDVSDLDGVRLRYHVRAYGGERIRNAVDFFKGITSGGGAGFAGAALAPPGAITFTPTLRDRFGFIGVKDLVAAGNKNALTEFHVAFAYVNEAAAQANYVALGDIDAASDPVTVPATVYGASGRFKIGSLFVIDHPIPDLTVIGRRAYEIFRIQDIVSDEFGVSWVLERAQLGSSKLEHPNGLKGYLLEFENMDPALGKGLFNTDPPVTVSGLPDQYWQLLPGACVVAVAGQLRNASGAGPVKVVNTNPLSYPVPSGDHNDNPAPGLRTLADEDYSLPVNGRLRVGQTMTHRKRVREGFCLAGSGCRIRIAPAGTGTFDGVIAPVGDVALGAYLLYISPPILGQPHADRYVAVLDQWAVGDSRFTSERDSSFFSQRRDPYNLKWPYRARVIGQLGELFNLSTGVFDTDAFPLSTSGAEIPTEEGGELDVLIAQVGSVIPGTDLMGFLLT